MMNMYSRLVFLINVHAIMILDKGVAVASLRLFEE